MGFKQRRVNNAQRVGKVKDGHPQTKPIKEDEPYLDPCSAIPEGLPTLERILRCPLILGILPKVKVQAELWSNVRCLARGEWDFKQ